MKKLIFILILIVFSSDAIAQKIIIDKKTTSVKNDSILAFKTLGSINSLTKSLYTELYLWKLDFKRQDPSSPTSEYFVDIPFTIKRMISIHKTFIFSMLLTGSKRWAILNHNEKSIVKSFNYLTDDEGNPYAIRQLNEHLSEPIKYAGTYYVRLLIDELPSKDDRVSIFVGAIDY